MNADSFERNATHVHTRFTRKIPDFNYTSHVQFPAEKPPNRATANGITMKDRAKMRPTAGLRDVLFSLRNVPLFCSDKSANPRSGCESMSSIRYAMRHDRIARGTCSRVSTGSVVSQQTASRTEKLDRVPVAEGTKLYGAVAIAAK